VRCAEELQRVGRRVEQTPAHRRVRVLPAVMAEAYTAAALHARHYCAVAGPGEIDEPGCSTDVMPEIRRLTRSHDELRAALILAGRRIRQLNLDAPQSHARSADGGCASDVFVSRLRTPAINSLMTAYRSSGEVSVGVGTPAIRFSSIAMS
jgi:hypothetical protein